MRAWIVVLGLALTTGSSAVLYPFMVARSTLRDVPITTDRSTSEAWLRQWAREHSATTKCDGSDCAAEVKVSNWLLARLNLAPPTLFTATISISSGKLVLVRLSLTDLDYQARRGASTATIIDYSETLDPEAKPATPRLVQEPVGKPPAVVYFVTPEVEPNARELARGINVWCLARIGGCLNSQQAPELWALRKTGVREGGTWDTHSQSVTTIGDDN